MANKIIIALDKSDNPTMYASACFFWVFFKAVVGTLFAVAIVPQVAFRNIVQYPDAGIVDTSSVAKKGTFKNIPFYLDEEGQYNFKDMVELLENGAFSNNSPLHRSKGPLWIHFKIRNDEQVPRSFYLYGQAYQYIWDVYNLRDPKPLRHGQDNAHKRSIFSRYPAVKVNLNPGEIQEYLIQTQTKYIMYSELMLLTESQYLKHTIIDHSLLALYYGLMLALIVYNLFLFVSTKEYSYFFYILFAGTMSLLLASADGMADLALGFLLGESFSRYSIILHPISLLCANIFVVSLLHIKRDYPLIYKTSLILNAVLVLVIALAALNQYFVADISNLITNIIGIGFIILGVYLWRKGSKPAKYFLIGWSMLISGSIFGVALAYLTSYSQEYRLFFLYLGSSLEILLMSFALASKLESLELEKSLLQIKEKEAAKLQKLVNILCHDLSNPINIIIGQIHKGRRKTNMQPELSPLWNKIEKSCRISTDILRNVRDMEALKLGKLSLIREPVSILEAIDHIKFVFAEQFKNKNLEIITNITEGNDLFILAEKTNFHNQVFANIVSNAIKFSEANSKIEIYAYSKYPNITLEIRDYGIGIPKDLVSKIFEETVQTNRLGTSGEKGTGFGLPLAKAFVIAFSGTIAVESYPISENPKDHGTKFILEFPIADTSNRLPEPKAS